jgi:hypothetical protein
MRKQRPIVERPEVGPLVEPNPAEQTHLVLVGLQLPQPDQTEQQTQLHPRQAVKRPQFVTTLYALSFILFAHCEISNLKTIKETPP